jgi:hypothetical protein
MAIELTADEVMIRQDGDIAHQRQLEIEQLRLSAATSINVSHKLELLRHAKDILIENRRNAPVNEREVTDEDIIKYASTLQSFLTK